MEKEILKKQEAICQTIGIHLYRSLLVFFDNVIRSDYDLIIFKVRKCYALFRAFEPFLDNIPRKNIISSNCIELYSSDDSIKKILIVDDILIHGRTLLNFKKKLKEILPDADVDIRVFAKYSKDNNDIELIKDCSLKEELRALRESVQCTHEVDEIGWKHISNCIMKCLYCTNTPHISFVPTFTLNKDSIFDLQKNSVEISTEVQLLCGMNSYIVLNPEQIFETTPVQCVVYRIYKVDNDIKFIPFYVQASLKDGILYNLDCFNKICNQKRYSGAFTFRLYTYIMSMMNALYYFKLNKIDNPIIDTLDIQYNFGIEISKNIERLYEKLCSLEIQDVYNEILLYAQQAKDSNTKYSTHANDFKNIVELYMENQYATSNIPSKVISLHFKHSNIIDENITSLERRDDVTINDISKILFLKGFDMKDIFASLISAMDRGVITYRINDKLKEDGYVYPCCYAGEQSYQPFSDDYEPVEFVLQKIEKEFPSENTEKKKQLLNDIENIFKKYDKEFDAQYIELFMNEKGDKFDEHSLLIQGLTNDFVGEIFDALSSIL